MATKEQLQAEFVRLVSDPLFGEDIIYIAGGVEYPIRAKVYRKGISKTERRFDSGTESEDIRYDVEVRLSSDAIYGRETVTIKDDKVKISKNIGGHVYTMRVAEVIDQDPGTWRVGLSV